jgi:hypothetical protein
MNDYLKKSYAIVLSDQTFLDSKKHKNLKEEALKIFGKYCFSAYAFIHFFLTCATINIIRGDCSNTIQLEEFDLFS